MKKLFIICLILLTGCSINSNNNEEVFLGAVTGSFLQSAVSTSDLTTYTFSSQNFGDAASDRYIVVAITSMSVSGGTISSVTIGGVSASIDAQVTNSSSNYTVSGIAKAIVPTGTSGDIVVTFGAEQLRAGIGVYRLLGISSTPTDTDTSTAADPKGYLDIAAGGYAIAVAYTAETATATWYKKLTNGFTERYDEDLEGAGSRQSGASEGFVDAETNMDITCNFTASLNSAGVFVSYEEAADDVCTPPVSGDWYVNSECWIASSIVVSGTVYIGTGGILHCIDGATISAEARSIGNGGKYSVNDNCKWSLHNFQ